MKTFFSVPITVVIVLLFVTGSSMAIPFAVVEGEMLLRDATIVDNLDGTSNINGLGYRFTVTDAIFDAEMNQLSLEFEDDVFTLVSSAYNYNPNDWTTYSMSLGGSSYTVSFAGTSIGVNESLFFNVDVMINNAAFEDDSLWGEGQVWSQSWSSEDTNNGGDGGSTTPVPEPTIMLLMGAGLAGLVVVTRRHKVRKI